MNNLKDTTQQTIDEEEHLNATDASERRNDVASTDNHYNTLTSATDVLGCDTNKPKSNSDPNNTNANVTTKYSAEKETNANRTSFDDCEARMPENATPILYRRAAQKCTVIADMTRRVSFPESDKELVTGCLEPANPWEYAGIVKSISELCEFYIKSCHKHATKPLPAVLDQLRSIDLGQRTRHCSLSLRSIKLTASDCEPLEEVFKRIQYKTVDLSSCELDECSVGAIFDMIEYYEATNELDISSNTNGMTHRGWLSCSNMVGRSQELTVLIAKGNPISKLGSDSLGGALNTSNLHTLKLEHCGLKGPPLTALCIHMHKNNKLKELWLSHNDLDCKDAGTLGDLLKVNHYLEFLDISNNNVTNSGLLLIVLALKAQSKEMDRISKSPEITPPSDLIPAFGHRAGVELDSSDSKTLGRVVNKKHDAFSSTSRLPHVADIFPESPIKFSNAMTNESPPPALPIVGQSMLDKLLSMNNESYCEKGDIMSATISVPAPPFKADVRNDLVETMTKTPTAAISSNHLASSTNALDGSKNSSFDNISDLKTPIVEEPLINFTITNNSSYMGEVDQVYEAIDDGLIKNFSRLEDIEDSHSTDSAFESASEGDLSRHLTEPEFNRRASDSIRIENPPTDSDALPLRIAAESVASSAVIKNINNNNNNNNPSNMQERFCNPLDVNIENMLSNAAAQFSPNSDNTLVNNQQPRESCDKDALYENTIPKVILRDGHCKDGGEPNFVATNVSINPTALFTQSTRLHSQSTDSLCSENSLDGSVSSDLNFSTSAQINEKLTKNDTLTRQLRQVDNVKVVSKQKPGGLKALALWNNNLTKESGAHIAQLLEDTGSLELLNIGKNCLSNEFIAQIKEALSKNTTVTTLGLQSTHLSKNGIQTLFSVFANGCENTLKRVDIRDNKVEVENLTHILDILKTNNTNLAQIDIDDEPKRLPVGTDEHKQYSQVLQNIRSMCSDNGNKQTQKPQQPDADSKIDYKTPKGNAFGGRKISLTCYSRPLLDLNAKSLSCPVPNELETKRTRLRSPLPSPPSVSPSSSPSRSRFQVFRVSESNLVAQPLSNKHSVSTGNLIPRNNASDMLNSRSITSQSLPTMSAVKQLSASPRSRFQVSRIYEDPLVPIAKRDLPPVSKDCSAASEDMPNKEHETGMMKTQMISENKSTTETNPTIFDKPPPPIEISTNPLSSVFDTREPITSLPLIALEPPVVVPVLVEDTAVPVKVEKILCCDSNESDNDKTLTKNSLKDGICYTGRDEDCCAAVSATAEQSKKSWINNTVPVEKLFHPVAVDRLITLFHSPIFPRSSSPDKVEGTVNVEMPQQHQQQNTIVPSRKITPPSWTYFDADHLFKQGGANDTNDAADEDKNCSTVGPSRSLLDVASKHLIDFSKQVFGQTNPFCTSDLNAAAPTSPTITPLTQQPNVAAGTAANSSIINTDNDDDPDVISADVVHVPTTTQCVNDMESNT